MREGTFNWSIKVLKERKFILDSKQVRNGKIQGFQYTLNPDMVKLSEHNAHREPHRKAVSPLTTPTVNHTMNLPHSIDDDSLIYKYHLNNAELEIIYPSLYEIGLRQNHLEEILEVWQLKSIDLAGMHDSLEKAEWDVARNQEKMDTPLNYIFMSLKRGPYTAPKGFKFAREIAEEQRSQRGRETPSFGRTDTSESVSSLVDRSD